MINRATGKIVCGPEIHARGVAEDDSVFDEIIPKINAALEEAVQASTDHTDAPAAAGGPPRGGHLGQPQAAPPPMIIPVVLEA